MRKQLSKNIVTLLLFLWAVLLPASALLAAEPDLVITGTGLREDVVIYPGDWGRYKEVIRYYSSNNNYDYHKIWKVRGYDIFELIGLGNLKKDKDYTAAFNSSMDGGRVSRTIKELQSQYFYDKFTTASGKLVAPMLSFYRTAVFEPDTQGCPKPNEVIWDDQEPTVDHDAPRLVMGQAHGDVDDNNQSFFNKKVGRIVVGEERPEGEKQVETDRDTASGGATGGKTEASETAPGKADAQDDDPVSGTDPEENGKADEPGEQNGATAPEEEPDSAAAAGPGSAKDSDSEELSGEQPRKVRWPWIAAGLILAGGAAGGAYYYHFRKRSA